MAKQDGTQLSAFISRIKKNGLLTGSHYMVVLPVLTNISSINPSTEGVSIMCESASLPGVRLALTDHRIFGEISEIPYMKTYGPVQLQFIIERNQKVFNYFLEWNNAIINNASRRSGYYNTYVQKVEIYVVDLESTNKIGYRLHDCFPSEISDVPLNYSSHDVIRLNVTLNYKYWEFIQLEATGEEASRPIFNYPTFTSTDRSIGGFPVEETEFFTELQRSETIYDLGEQLQSNINSSGLSFDRYGDFASKAIEYAKVHGVDALRKQNAAYALLEQQLGSNANTRLMGKNILELGQITNEMGKKISDLGTLEFSSGSQISLGQTIGYFSATLQSLNITASGLGLGNPFAAAISSLASIKARFDLGTLTPDQLAIELNNLQLQVKAVGNGYKNISELMLLIPGGNTMIENSVNALSTAYLDNGESLSQIRNFIG